MGFTKTRVTGTVGADTYSSYSTDALSPEVGAETRTDEDMLGIKGGFGRGHTDQDITFFALTNENNDLTYIYPNAAQNGVIVSATKP